jgi:GNAT superfamily N-acetyltransferase
VALRDIDSCSCEMKRMFVYPQHHGRGVGRALAEAIIKEARALGYRAMRLGHERSPGRGQRTLPTARLPDHQAVL